MNLFFNDIVFNLLIYTQYETLPHIYKINVFLGRHNLLLIKMMNRGKNITSKSVVVYKVKQINKGGRALLSF